MNNQFINSGKTPWFFMACWPKVKDVETLADQSENHGNLWSFQPSEIR